MSVYLIKTTEQYRVDTENEAQELINNAKAGNNFELKKYSSALAEVKKQGEVIDSWYKVQLTKTFTSEKEPDQQVVPTYENEGAWE